jgi:hypothetical protein
MRPVLSSRPAAAINQSFRDVLEYPCAFGFAGKLSHERHFFLHACCNTIWGTLAAGRYGLEQHAWHCDALPFAVHMKRHIEPRGRSIWSAVARDSL